MIKFSKKHIFVLLLVNSIMLGVSLSDVDWSLFSRSYFKEGLLPSIFLLLTINFLVQYVQVLKDEKKTKS